MDMALGLLQGEPDRALEEERAVLAKPDAGGGTQQGQSHATGSPDSFQQGDRLLDAGRDPGRLQEEFLRGTQRRVQAGEAE